VNIETAAHLLEGSVPGTPGTWADLGCGTGTFTLALAGLLGPAARIFAVDKDGRALAGLRRALPDPTGVIPVHGDFTAPMRLPGFEGALDGILFANSLHYVADPERVLAFWTARLRPEGRVVFVEYDRRSANRWVHYPISPARLEELTAAAHLAPPVITATQPSEFTGTLYAAFAMKPRAGAESTRER